MGSDAATTVATRVLLVPDAIIDPPHPPRVGMVVLVANGIIEAVGRRDEFGAGLPTVELGGLTLLPGLIDAHLHLQLQPLDTDEAVVAAYRDDLAASRGSSVAEAHARLELIAGTTTVRDCGSGDSLFELRQRSATPLPRLLMVGRPVTRSRGHLHWMGRIADDRAGMTTVVDELASQGADAIKVIASGGMMTAGSRVTDMPYRPDELVALVDRAHRHGLPVVAHASNTEAIAACTEAGVDTLDHCRWTGPDGALQFRPEVAARILEQRTGVGLTAAGNIRPLAATDAGRATLRENYRHHRTLRDAGVMVGVHSDAGVTDTPFGTFAESVAAGQIALGMSALEALEAVTATAATIVGLGDVVGRLRPGFAADLIAVAGNPADDVAALADVRRVFRDGTLVAADGAVV